MSDDVSAKSLLRTVNGRRFRLEEYTLAETGRFMDAINEAVAADQAAWSEVGTPSMGEAMSRVAASLEGVFDLILRHPVDGLGPVDSEFISSLRLSQRERLLELQSELNHLEDVNWSKKVYAVLLAVSAWRTATDFAPLSGSAAMLSQSTTTASTPRRWSLRGLLARLRGLWPTSRGRAGTKPSATSP